MWGFVCYNFPSLLIRVETTNEGYTRAKTNYLHRKKEPLLFKPILFFRCMFTLLFCGKIIEQEKFSAREVSGDQV